MSLKFCGYSGAGKTTLICRLISMLGERYRIGYTKSDAHQIEIHSKDSAKVFAAGARSVRVSDQQSGMARWHHPTAVFLDDALRADSNLEFAEGWKFEPGDKLVMIDDEHRILTDVRDGRVCDVIAYVGKFEQVDGLDAPYFQRDDLGAISAFVEAWVSRQRRPQLKGLVLTGGMSRRMGSDKALLRYGEKTQVEVGLEMLAEVCGRTYVSCRPGQFDEAEWGWLPKIEDRMLGYGPIGGILSAMESDPEAAWLVLACDLPMLKLEILRYLVQHRDPLQYASCYSDPDSQMPEPLCAIYEPRVRPLIFDYLKYGVYCPRKLLINVDAHRLTLPIERALENANHHHEFESLRLELQQGSRL